MKLTPEQEAVIHHRGGHARVAAVAGAGKTTTMAARVLHLLESGVAPGRMLVLMFNRCAREDFRRRLTSMAGQDQALPDVRTFHSLGHRLTQSLCRWGALEARRLLSAEWQLERLLRKASLNVLADQSERREAALAADRLETLAHFCGLVKAELAAPEALFERLGLDDESDYFPGAFREVERLLQSHALMTYADLLYRPLKALEADAALRGRVEGFLDHVIIDEYQDINPAQQRLLKVLAGERASVMAVGDANQCIYEWRGARPDTMLDDFTATFGAAADYPLSTTFRHGHALALTANQAIMNNARRPDQLCLAAPSTTATRIEAGQGNRPLLQALAEWASAGRSYGEVSLLVRSWALSVPFQLALLQAGIAFRLAREDRFVFRLPLVQALAGYLKLARRPALLQNPEHLLLLLAQPTPFVARERLAGLARRLAATQAFPTRDDPLLAPLKPIQRRTLQKRWWLLCDLPTLGHWPPARLLQHVVTTIEAEKTLKRAATRRDKGEEDVRLLDVLIDQAESVSDADAFIELLERPVKNQAGGVSIGTVHGAKGLEWPLVIVAGVNEEDFPHYSRDNPLSEARLEEERRLFYVAITRAREQLLMLHDGGAHRPSRFIQESGWADSVRVARALDDHAATQAPLEVGASALIERYLARAGRADIAIRSLPSGATTQNGPGPPQPGVAEFYPGQRLLHEVFGEGEVAAVEGNPADPVIDVRFIKAGRRRLIARRAPITPLASTGPA